MPPVTPMDVRPPSPNLDWRERSPGSPTTILWKTITSNLLPEKIPYTFAMAGWSFLTNHARVLVCIAHDPGVRLRDIAVTLEITERSAYGIVTELATAGYVVKERDGRRNRYRIEEHMPLPEKIGRERTIGEVLDVLVDARLLEQRGHGPADRKPPEGTKTKI